MFARIVTVKKKRICPDCETRELEKGLHFCSECGEAREFISLLIRQDKYRKSEKGKAVQAKINRSAKRKASQSRFNRTEKRRKYMREYQRQRRAAA